jgi:hypothetical protein
MRLAWLVGLFPVTVDDDIDVHVPVGSRVRCALWSLDGSIELRSIAYLRCGRCRIPNPYNILGEGEIRRTIYGVYYVIYFYPFLILFCFVLFLIFI